MDKYEIINTWAKNKEVETIVKKYEVKHPDDLTQMIYYDLLQKDDSVIQELYKKNQYNFYIARMVTNQVISTTSSYYMQQERMTSSNYLSLNDAIKFTDEADEDNKKYAEVMKVLNTKFTPFERNLIIAHLDRDIETCLEIYNEEKGYICRPSLYRYMDKLMERVGKELSHLGRILPKEKGMWVKDFETGEITHYDNLKDIQLLTGIPTLSMINEYKRNDRKYKGRWLFKKHKEDF